MSSEKNLVDVPLHKSFHLFPRPIAVLTTIHLTGTRCQGEYFCKMPGLTYRSDVDYDGAPMSTLTLQGKRPPNHSGPFEKAGPPVHLVSISPSRKTYRNLIETGETVANFFPPTQESAEMMYILSDGRYKEGNDKIKASGVTLENSKLLNTPRIAEAMAWVEYRLIRVIPVPKSERPIFLLRPVTAYCREGFIDKRTHAYCTPFVPLGQICSNICTGSTKIIVAGKVTKGKGLSSEEHWRYSDRKSEEPFLDENIGKGGSDESH
ncbi:hypothetical protein C4569_02895 [Candidatus Parcubacteria bacterium]|nr:MAG: hypothetical protein C4569_02895 [Candidatus Parcubacteria bacterium]